MDKIKQQDHFERQTPKKKAYHAPVLSLYGDVSQITKGTGGINGDGTTNMSRVCWIAEALYGIDAPRTLLVRAWLRESYERRATWARVVVPMYRRFGQRVAASVRRHSSVRRLFLPLFDHAVRQAHREFAQQVALQQAA